MQNAHPPHREGGRIGVANQAFGPLRLHRNLQGNSSGDFAEACFRFMRKFMQASATRAAKLCSRFSYLIGARGGPGGIVHFRFPPAALRRFRRAKAASSPHRKGGHRGGLVKPLFRQILLLILQHVVKQLEAFIGHDRAHQRIVHEGGEAQLAVAVESRAQGVLLVADMAGDQG